MRRDLTLQELSDVTGRHIETLRRLARAAKLPGVCRLGRRWLISRRAADALRHLPGPSHDSTPWKRSEGPSAEPEPGQDHQAL